MPTPLQDPSIVIAAICAVLAVAIAARGVMLWRRVRGTTLAAPAVWMVVVAAFMAIVELTLAAQRHPGDTLGASIARYAAAVGTFCPLMAVLGAKRPQDRGWQWVVLSLWVILLVPAGQTWAAHAANRVTLAPAWQIMLWALIALAPLNYLLTGNAAAAIVTAAAQYALLRPYWFDVSPALEAKIRLAVLVALAAVTFARPKRGDSAFFISDELSFDDYPSYIFTPRWLAFRNAWGAFWALRILQRVNEAATLSNWPVRLEWSGFVPASDSTPASNAAPQQLDERTAAHIQQTLDTLLRRFERTSLA